MKLALPAAPLREMDRASGIYMCPTLERDGQTKFTFGPLDGGW